jgi:outer membrane protein W
MTRRTPRHLAVAALVAGMLAAAPPARAQGSGDGFLFRAPTGALVLRLGMDQPLANSDLFSDVTSQFTLRKSDFRGLSLGGELDAQLGPRTTLVFEASWSGARHGSEYQHFVDNNNLPIQQTTSFQRVPLTVGVRYYLGLPGQAIGRLAWVPSRYSPWVGFGVGAVWYRFRQSGDFINLSTMNVYADDLASSDWAFTAHVNAGVDVSLSPRTFVSAEGRYAWGRAHLGAAYSGYAPIDLSGLAFTIGFGYRM